MCPQNEMDDDAPCCKQASLCVPNSCRGPVARCTALPPPANGCTLPGGNLSDSPPPVAPVVVVEALAAAVVGGGGLAFCFAFRWSAIRSGTNSWANLLPVVLLEFDLVSTSTRSIPRRICDKMIGRGENSQRSEKQLAHTRHRISCHDQLSWRSVATSSCSVHLLLCVCAVVPRRSFGCRSAWLVGRLIACARALCGACMPCAMMHGVKTKMTYDKSTSCPATSSPRTSTSTVAKAHYRYQRAQAQDGPKVNDGTNTPCERGTRLASAFYTQDGERTHVRTYLRTGVVTPPKHQPTTAALLQCRACLAPGGGDDSRSQQGTATTYSFSKVRLPYASKQATCMAALFPCRRSGQACVRSIIRVCFPPCKIIHFHSPTVSVRTSFHTNSSNAAARVAFEWTSETHQRCVSHQTAINSGRLSQRQRLMCTRRYALVIGHEVPALRTDQPGRPRTTGEDAERQKGEPTNYRNERVDPTNR